MQFSGNGSKLSRPNGSLIRRRFSPLESLGWIPSFYIIYVANIWVNYDTKLERHPFLMGIHTDIYIYIYIYLYTSTANGHFQSLSIALLNYQRVSWSIFGHSAWHMAKRSPVKAKAPNDRHTWIAGSILLVPLASAAWQAVTYLGSFYLYTCTVCIHAHKYNIYIYIYI